MLNDLRATIKIFQRAKRKKGWNLDLEVDKKSIDLIYFPMLDLHSWGEYKRERERERTGIYVTDGVF